MSKIVKKVNAIILSFAMVLSVIPFASATVFAEEAASIDNIEFMVNGEVKGYITREWLNENEMDEAQVFPYASKKKYGEISYKIEQGVDINKIFEKFGYTKEEFAGATIYSCQGEATDGKNPLKVDHLIKATKVMKGKWDTAKGCDGRKFIKLSSKRYAEVTPIFVTKATAATYTSYEQALDALDDADLVKTTMLAVGNSGDKYLALDTKEGQTEWIAEGNNGAIDCCARYGITDLVRINVVTPEAEAIVLDRAEMTFNAEKSQKIGVSFEPVSAVYTAPIVWTSDNEAVAKVDESGNVTPVGIGTCNVKATVGSLEETVAVTVNAKAFTPAKVSSLKATNKGGKKVALSWKKVSKASGYVVAYKKSGAKKWTEKTTTKNTYKVSKLTKGKKYQFKVKAYRTVSGKKVYGSYSSVKTIKKIK